MARRVVKAEAKRRLREERKKAKEVTNSRAQNHAKTKSTTTSQILDNDKIAPKMKRLFKWAVVRLLGDGSIVLWDGPVHACQKMSSSHASLWKTNTTTSNPTMDADSTILSTISEVAHSANEEEDRENIELSDPELQEEAYVPLSPSYLAEHVAKAIDVLTTDVETTANRIRRPPQSTMQGILAYLKNDDRWRFIGEWNVEEALQVLKNEKRAWCVEKGRWELAV
jgi:hypothetical protein